MVDMLAGVLRRGNISLVPAALFYGLVIHIAYIFYLFPHWGYFGFTYRAPDIVDYLIAIVLIVMVSLSAPRLIDRPSAAINFILLLTLTIPTIVVTTCIGREDAFAYRPILVAFGVAATIANLITRQPLVLGEGRYPDRGFALGLLLISVPVATYLAYRYRDVLAFVPFDDVYGQRELGRAGNLMEGYLQTYTSNVFGPALLAYALVRRNILIGLVAFAVFALMYSINAQKAYLLVPILIFGVFASLALPIRMLRSLSFLTFCFSMVLLFLVFQAEASGLWATITNTVLFRAVATPGLTLSLYQDVFGEIGLTYWSHVRGISSLVPAPISVIGDPVWPQLGHFIGAHAYGDWKHNYNANLFAGDGVAAAGWIGVLVIGCVLTVWLRLLDLLSTAWDSRFTALIAVPLGVTLSNGHMFTMLASFGGIFWLVVLPLYPALRNLFVHQRLAPPT